MVAAGDLEITPRVGKVPLFHILHPSAVDAQGNVVLSLAGDRASVAADAFAVVDDEAVVHGAQARSPCPFVSRGRRAGKIGNLSRSLWRAGFSRRGASAPRGPIMFTLWGRPSFVVVCRSCGRADDTRRSSAPRRRLVSEQYYRSAAFQAAGPARKRVRRAAKPAPRTRESYSSRWRRYPKTDWQPPDPARRRRSRSPQPYRRSRFQLRNRWAPGTIHCRSPAES